MGVAHTARMLQTLWSPCAAPLENMESSPPLSKSKTCFSWENDFYNVLQSWKFTITAPQWFIRT